METTTKVQLSKKFMVEVILMMDADSYEQAMDKVNTVLCQFDNCESFIVKEPVETEQVMARSNTVQEQVVAA